MARNMDVDFWNDAFQWGGIVLLAFTFVVGAGALWTGKKINKRQTERLLTLETDRDAARAELAKQQRDVTTAATKLAEVALAVEQQRERAATAERTLETERAARLNLDRRTANRWLKPDTFNALSSAMAKYAGQPADVVVFPVNFESVGIADLIHGILGNAKWKAGLSAKRLPEALRLPTQLGGMAPIMVQGVYIRTSADEGSKAAGRALYDALSKTIAGGVYDPAPLPGEPRVVILIGDKPTPLSVWVRE